jgi:hypothetical protein
MALVATQIQDLLSPPSTSRSHVTALAYIDEAFPTLESLIGDENLDRHCDQAQTSSLKLSNEVRGPCALLIPSET